jgi:hypothetical protein
MNSMIAVSNVNSRNNDDKVYSSPVFYLPEVMPLSSGSVYAPFETDETGATYYPVREYAADYSYDNFEWQGQGVDQQREYRVESVPSNDDLPLSPTDSMVTSSSSEEDPELMAMSQGEASLGIASNSPHSCFSSIAVYAAKGYF